jgi:hypothetical protein
MQAVAPGREKRFHGGAVQPVLAVCDGGRCQHCREGGSNDALAHGLQQIGNAAAPDKRVCRRLKIQTAQNPVIPGEHTRDRSVLVGKLAEILRGTRPSRKVAAMFIDMAFGSPIYERLRALLFVGRRIQRRGQPAVTHRMFR